MLRLDTTMTHARYQLFTTGPVSDWVAAPTLVRGTVGLHVGQNAWNLKICAKPEATLTAGKHSNYSMSDMQHCSFAGAPEQQNPEHHWDVQPPNPLTHCVASFQILHSPQIKEITTRSEFFDRYGRRSIVHA